MKFAQGALVMRIEGTATARRISSGPVSIVLLHIPSNGPAPIAVAFGKYAIVLTSSPT